mgnify:CR=1 FL=1
MATGPGLGALMTALVPLVGIATILKARYRRKRGLPEPENKGFEERRAATRESERRMAAYLAQRGSAGYQVSEDGEQEIRR